MEQQVKLLVAVSTVAVTVLAVAGGIILYGSLSNDSDDSDAISYSSDWKDYAEKLDQYGGYVVRAGITYSESHGYSSGVPSRVSYPITVSTDDVVTLKGDLLEISKYDKSNHQTEYSVIPLSQIEMIHYYIPDQS